MYKRCERACWKWNFITVLWLLLSISAAHAQNNPGALQATVSTAANEGYLRLLSSPGLSGNRYRLEWGMPVKTPALMLDAFSGGLLPYAADTVLYGKMLYLRSASGDAYTLRSVQKDLSVRLAPIYQNTIVSAFAYDLSSAYHPYAPLAVAPMAAALQLQWPAAYLVYLPQQKNLNGYNAAYGNGLYFLQKSAVPYGADTATTLVSTQRLLQLLQSNYLYRVDEKAYLRTRLLDAVLGVSQRGEESWQWLAKAKDGHLVYTPVPLHFDDAFAVYDGRYTQVAKRLAGIKHLQSFGPQIPEPAQIHLKSVHLDRWLTATLNRKDWEGIADEVTKALSNDVLQAAIANLPPEVQALSGNRLLAALRSRRDGLKDHAMRYYSLLAKSVDVVASQQPEKLTANGNGAGLVNIRIQPAGADSLTIIYNRNFFKKETREVNVYGTGGNDLFNIAEKLGRSIRLRFIGGPQKDSLVNYSQNANLHLYDNRRNAYNNAGTIRYHLHNRTGVHRYDYAAFTPNKKGFAPVLFYNFNDRLFAGIAYQQRLQGWRKHPFARTHRLFLNYSIMQAGFSMGYEGVFNQLVGEWNGLATVGYDAVRWTNFFGVGNETPPQIEDNDYYRMRSEIFNTEAGLERPLGKHHSIGFVGRFQTVRIRQDEDRYVFKNIPDSVALLFRTRQFAGGRLSYRYQNSDDAVLPTKGLFLSGSVEYAKNLTVKTKEIIDYTAGLQVFLPLHKNWVWSTAAGIEAVTGEPEFYQLASIGGTATLRGFRRDRFWGKTAFYNQNELQWRLPYRSYFFNGTVGIIALYDLGRVWQPGEASGKLHTAFGGGFLLSPFNRLRLSLTYARSDERGLLHVGIGRNL